MMNNLQTLEPALGLAHGRTIGDEPAFTYPDVLDAILTCTQHKIAVLGVELMRAVPQGYSTESMSPYEVQLNEHPWHEFVALNNSLAIEYVKQNKGGDDHFYLLTASQQSEFSSLAG